MHGNMRKRGNIILFPQPTDDERDPLNWSQRKKYAMLSVLSLAAFASHGAALANQLSISLQAKLYHRTLNDMADTIATAIAGVLAGPLILMPLTHVFGCCSIFLWSMVAAICGSIWSALMTNPDQYVGFIISRLFVGLFSATPTILGPQMLIDVFFLHERGRVFNIFMVWSNAGVIVGPTLGGFIIQHAPWPWAFWWAVALQGITIVLIFLFLEETGFTRKSGIIYPPRPTGFIQNRVATYFPGTRVAHLGGIKTALRSAWTQILIGITPVTILVGIFILGFSGWFVSFNTLLGVFLQNPLEAGGYGFSPQQNAAFTFTMWISAGAAQLWGHFFNDRLALYSAAKHSGIWKPEYRLHALWIPAMVLMPVGLGIVGVSLQHHLHYMILAVGTFFVTFGSFCINPIAINYLVECFLGHPTELSCILGVYRLGLGLGIPFFINSWVSQVGVGWVFGTMALLCLMLFIPITVLLLDGHRIRQMGFEHLHVDEEGIQIVQKDELDEASSR